MLGCLFGYLSLHVACLVVWSVVCCCTLHAWLLGRLFVVACLFGC
jgi:hypothetical protein